MKSSRKWGLAYNCITYLRKDKGLPPEKTASGSLKTVYHLAVNLTNCTYINKGTMGIRPNSSLGRRPELGTIPPDEG